jgi:hypothetical protein
MQARLLYILLILIGLNIPAMAQHKHHKKKPVTVKKAKPGKKITLARNATSPKDTLLKGATIEIIQSYKPEVRQTPKPEMTATLPPADTARPQFNYTVPPQSLYYTYNSMPLRPLALGQDSSAIPFANYVKVGGGNLSTLYFDVGIGSLKGENYESAIHLHHLSQTGDYSDQKISLSGLEAEGTLHKNDHAWHASLDGLRNEYHYYGYDHTLYKYSVDSTKQVYTGIRLNIDMKNETEGFKRIDYHPSVNASLYNDKFDASERSAGFNLPLSYSIDTSLQLQLAFKGEFTKLTLQTTDATNNIFLITPGIHMHKGAIDAHASVSPAFGNVGAYILPDIGATIKLKNGKYNFIAGWYGSLRQNTYEQLSTRNPYMYNAFLVRQTHTTEVYGGVNGAIGNHISFNVRISWWEFHNLPLFINDTSTADEKNFLVVYDDQLNAVSLQGAIRYQIANTLSVGFTASTYNYSNNTFRHVWHEPAVNMKADLTIRPVKDLVVTGYMSVIDEIWAVEKNNQSVKLSGAFEIGGSAEYSFIPRLSAFLQVNNLLNNKYERWYGYKSFGLNVFGGVRLKF